jgi:integrase
MPEPHRPGRRRGGKGWIYPYDPTAVWRRLMRAVVAVGGKAITMYGMRHSFASNCLIQNRSAAKVAHWLGHADERMLYRHYGHLLSYDPDISALRADIPVLKAPKSKIGKSVNTGGLFPPTSLGS